MITWTKLSAIHGFLGVAAGAFGSHALKERLLTSGFLETWKTAASYQLMHGVVMLAAALVLEMSRPELTKSLRLRPALMLWFWGTSIFSGSLYVLCLSPWRAVAWATPLGGVLLVGAWFCLLVPKKVSQQS